MALRCRVVVKVSLLVVLVVLHGTAFMPMKGKYTINYIQYPFVVGCVCMLNDWITCNDDFCPDNYNYSRFKLRYKCRSEKWEVYLYGDMTIMVERAQVQFLDSVTCPLCYDRAWSPVVQKTAEVSAVAAHGVMGRLFLGRVHRYTARGDPRH